MTLKILHMFTGIIDCDAVSGQTGSVGSRIAVLPRNLGKLYGFLFLVDVYSFLNFMHIK